MTNIVRRTISFCLFLVLVTTGALAQQQRAVNDEPSAARLRADVTYLASDKLDGRRTGTPGAEAAARYIADEFKRLGLKPGASRQFNFAAGQRKSEEQQGTYLQTFPYIASVEAGKGNTMAFTRKLGEMVGGTPAPALDLRVGEDWMPLAWSANGRIERAPVVYVGYGITANDLNHDDYAGVNVKDKIALAFVGTPDGDNPHGAFVRYNDLRFKAAAARDHGARALLLITREENFKDDKLAHLHLDDNAAGDAGLPVVLISRQVARSAIEAAAMPAVRFEALEAALNVPAANTPSSGAGQPSAQPAPAPAKNFSAALNNIAFSLTTDLIRREAPAANVIGVLPGSDAKLQDELIIIGAHYDHLGHGGQGSLAPREGEIHHGADDNASGTAALLELARLFSVTRAPHARLHRVQRRRRGLAWLGLLRQTARAPARADRRDDQHGYGRAFAGRQVKRRRRGHGRRVA
jgi:Peptidase family M28/PA domain